MDAYFTRLLSAFSQEFARVDQRIDDLIDEADPRTTLEMLPDWERLAGLPDPCVTSEQTVEQRQSALVSKLTMQGGQSRAYYIQTAEDLGYPAATIEEYFPFTCESYCDEFLNSIADRHTWTIFLPSDGGFEVMTCESPCDSFLQSFGDEVIECRINQYKPAHTKVLFAYTV
jgi:uncharacterized protein YmfQ (DUF2313 family)